MQRQPKRGILSTGRRWISAFVLSLCALSPQVAEAQQAAKEVFGRIPLPSVSAPQSYGFYTKGCISGAVAMPTDGPTWQAMRLERNRRWGHPKLIALLQKLSSEAVADGWPGLLVGDISQPRGGPMLTGHASHQVGLDADIWLTPMPNRRLTEQERRDTSAITMLKDNGNSLYVDPAKWSNSRAKLLKRAASYPEVERMFVHPGIKKVMCETYGADRANDFWMIKIRPYYGHHYHFHIRLKCPSDSANCKKQDPVPASGNGCDKSLDWWFTAEPWTPAKPKPGTKPVKPRVVTVADLPNACTGVVGAPAPANERLVTLDSNYDLTAALSSTQPVAAYAAPSASTDLVWPIPSTRP